MADCCPLCQSSHITPYFKNKDSAYLICPNCDLVFAPKQYHLSESAEKNRYDSHQNNPSDKHYREFLSKVFIPVMDYIKPNDKGLDFGSGPGPTLSVMFEEKGYKMDLFDKFYANNPLIFNNKYDFITATEVFEHLKEPDIHLKKIRNIMSKTAVLAVMTKMRNDDIDFSSWYYKDDPTHICFFSKNTMRYLGKVWDTDVKFYEDDVVLFLNKN